MLVHGASLWYYTILNNLNKRDIYMIYLTYLIEFSFGMGLFLKAILFIPQALKLFKLKDSSQLSILTFIGLNIMKFLTVLHAYIHKDRILMFGILLNLLICGSISYMIIRYRHCKKIK